MKKRGGGYILTKEGREYSDAGIDYICGRMKSLHNIEKDDINILQGGVLNDVQFLAKDIIEQDGAYIFVSRPDKIFSLHADAAKEFAERLMHAENMTSWEFANLDILGGRKGESETS